ncbi:hypothetical protein CEXT_375711 [Caerostris extrusa]|uniref:Uncharacterized protein n=1 Tax=Caerostris extrusa TaxID=172846 RepID=A0AAV4RW33_CAEEX|nr:hypothetical protein CEXT_375711 [Caerostris extrusa]
MSSDNFAFKFPSAHVPLCAAERGLLYYPKIRHLKAHWVCKFDTLWQGFRHEICTPHCPCQHSLLKDLLRVFSCNGTARALNSGVGAAEKFRSTPTLSNVPLHPYTTPSSSASLLLHPLRTLYQSDRRHHRPTRLIIIISARLAIAIKNQTIFLSTTPDDIFGGKMFDIASVQLFMGCYEGQYISDEMVREGVRLEFKGLEEFPNDHESFKIRRGLNTADGEC